MNDNGTTWQPPSLSPDDSGLPGGHRSGGHPEQPAPRFGAYGTPPAGAPPSSPYLPPGAPTTPGVFMVAPKPGIVPLRPLSIGDIIGGAFDSLRANPRAMFIPSLIVMTVAAIISAGLNYLTYESPAPIPETSGPGPALEVETTQALFSDDPSELLTIFASGLSVTLATAVLSGLLIVAVSRSVLGRVATPGEIWRRTRGRILALMGQALIINILTYVIGAVVAIGGAALALTVIAPQVSENGASAPGIILVVLLTLVLLGAGVVGACFLWVRLSVAPAALVLENVGVFEGLKRSWVLTRGSFWRVLGTLVLSVIITTVATTVIGGAVGTVGGIFIAIFFIGSIPVVTSVIILVTTLLNALVLPFLAAVTALIYIDLRMRAEGLDVELRQAAE